MACYDIIGDAHGAISSTKGQYVILVVIVDVTRITGSDFRHIIVAGVTFMRLETH